MIEEKAQRACYAASSICLLGGILLGIVGVAMIIFGLQTTEKLDDRVWEVSVLIFGVSCFIVLLGSLGCAFTCSRQMVISREKSIIKCMAIHAGIAETPDGMPPCCTKDSDTMKVWSTVNPHSRIAWSADLPGQNGDENSENKDGDEEEDT